MNYLKKLIIKWCYKLIEVFDDSYNDNENLKSVIQVKDVYWCQMPLSNKELTKVTPGHRIRPYVIEEVNEDGVVALTSSSKPFSYVIKERQLFISKSKYHLCKNSFIDTTKKTYISWNNIKEYYYTLDDDDFNQIDEKRNQKIFKQNKNQELGIGTLIDYDNGLYLITNIIEDSFIGHKLYNQKDRINNKQYISISYDSKVYFISFEEQKRLHKQKKYTVVFQYDDTTIKLIRKKIKDIRSKKQKKNQIDKNVSFIYQPGSIFSYAVDDIFMYLFNRKNSIYGVFLEEEILCLKKINSDYLRDTIEINVECLRDVINNLSVNHNDDYAINRIRLEYLNK
ncbi:hypothetical protein [Breznakia pachnodae]|uniref:Uncharacterized protein n=1 Tax=Breznakia pachnodae TaxID=265178 RepID=A0ABU0E6R7_9FIRM|nr:hypothetical protein [Breznakia pachnodae]MDQ0362165.1 hypothetical protein [Breznakia pachnodae]